jgi:hypothetical protein
MSDKSKKFNPPMGWIVAVNHQEVSVYRVAEQLGVSEYNLAVALEKAGYKLEVDQMDLMSDTAKVILKAGETRNPNHIKLVPEPTMADVAESVTELDEEEAEGEQ